MQDKLYLGLGVLLIFFFVLVKPMIAYSTDEWVQFRVKQKERIVSNSSEGTSSKYLVFTDKGTFQNTDTIFYLKYNSSDIQGSIKDGEIYKARVYGFRVPFFSWYQNIITIEPVK